MSLSEILAQDHARPDPASDHEVGEALDQDQPESAREHQIREKIRRTLPAAP